MGTRSDIIVERKDGKWHRIYCHWDGYIAGVGATLLQHYNSQERAEKLVTPGDLSACYANCDKPKGHTFDKPVAGYCVYYGRDRGEKDVGGTIGDSLPAVWPGDDTGTEFTYVFKDGLWWVGDADEGTQGLRLLADAIAGIAVITPKVKAFGGNFVIGKHKPHNLADV